MPTNNQPAEPTFTLCGIEGLRVPIAKMFYREADEIYFEFPVYDYDIEFTLVHIPEYSAGLLKKPRDMKALALIASYASTAWEIEGDNLTPKPDSSRPFGAHLCPHCQKLHHPSVSCKEGYEHRMAHREELEAKALLIVEAHKQAQLWRSVARKAGER
jgi:hypothetical protein